MIGKRLLHIAIDGPVAAGKGDIAKRLADSLGIVFVNTGSMYRALALACIERNVDTKNAEQVVHVLQSVHIVLVPPSHAEDQMRMLLDGKDVTERIMAPDVSRGSSDVATIKAVRPIMVTMQQEFAAHQSVVMEGRDIGLRVLPNADIKIYLTASLEERARRRHAQWKEKGVQKTMEETVLETKLRDEQDMHRQHDPLQKLPDAWELDTTGFTQDQVVEKITTELRKRNLI